MIEPEPFTVAFADDQLDDLHARLRRTRFAPDDHNEDWRYGVPTAALEDWVDAWLGFDWRTAERAINHHQQFVAEIDGVPVHYVLRRSSRPGAVPLLLLHGWPWTFWDYNALIEPLAEPRDAGTVAFDVVLPSLPGFIFSTPVRTEGIGFTEMADVLAKLMLEVLGYGRFAACGGDYGALVAGALGHRHADCLLGIQLFGAVPISVWTGSTPLNRPPNFGFEAPSDIADPVLRTPQRTPRRPHGSAHAPVHALEPQTLAAAMHDSPAGMMAWLLHRRYWWSDSSGDVLQAFTREFLLTTFSLYWLSDSIGSTFRRYHDMVFNPWQPSHGRTPIVEAPTSIAFFDGDDLTGRIRFWVPEHYNVVRVTSHSRGGHFAPAEVPDTCISELRQAFAS